jgi:hypothetical protein
VPLASPVAASVPSGLIADENTFALLLPRSVAIWRPLAADHTYPLPFLSPVTSVPPSPLKVTESTCRVAPGSVSVRTIV